MKCNYFFYLVEKFKDISQSDETKKKLFDELLKPQNVRIFVWSSENSKIKELISVLNDDEKESLKTEIQKIKKIEEEVPEEKKSSKFIIKLNNASKSLGGQASCSPSPNWFSLILPCIYASPSK